MNAHRSGTFNEFEDDLDHFANNQLWIGPVIFVYIRNPVLLIEFVNYKYIKFILFAANSFL